MSLRLHADSMSMPKFNRAIPLCLLFSTLFGLPTTGGTEAFAQSVTGTDGTIVTTTGDQINITNGQVNGTNLFHSFDRFSVGKNQTATFQVDTNIANVLARITGGQPTHIDGRVGFTPGTQPNFYFMNPAGILFGPNASISFPGSFTATTASGIGFNNGWWDVQSGFSPGGAFVGNPIAVRFSPDTPGAIVNRGTISSGSNFLNLIGGTVISTGSITSINNAINIVTVPGNTLVQLNVAGSPLGIAIAPSMVTPLGFTPTALPALITGSPNTDATDLVVNPDGTVTLITAATTSTQAPRNLTLQVGDIYINNLGNDIKAPQQLNLQAQGYLLSNRANRIETQNPLGQPGLIQLIGDRGIDVGDIVTQSTTERFNPGKVTLTSKLGNVLVDTIQSGDGGIAIDAHGVFQARSTVSNPRLTDVPLSLLSNGTINIRYGSAPTTSAIIAVSSNFKLQGNGARFIIGPDRLGTEYVSTPLSPNVSGTAGGISITSGDSNNPPIVFQDRRFGTLEAPSNPLTPSNPPLPGASMARSDNSIDVTSPAAPVPSLGQNPPPRFADRQARSCQSRSSNQIASTDSATQSSIEDCQSTINQSPIVNNDAILKILQSSPGE
jgi:filamentous hemagglutinin family protein